MSIRLQQSLGFYVMVFQSQLNGLVKCWLDGSEDWTFYTEAEMLEFTCKEGGSYGLRQRMKDCLTETSFFIWVIESDVIKRLQSIPEPSDIGSYLTIPSAIKATAPKRNELDPQAIMFDWRKNIKINGNNILG